MSNRQIMMLSRCFISSTTIIIILFITIAPTTLFAFQLTSSSTIPYLSPTNLHNFLATPTNWPQIVLSSHSVKCPSFTNNRVDIPLREGDYVEEIFGLPPLLPLSVVWECVSSDVDDGLLEFYSKDGVPGFASECKMIFNIQQIQHDGQEELGDTTCCVVKLIMEFEMTNPLIPLAVPFLSIDNNLALNVLLPRATSRKYTTNI